MKTAMQQLKTALVETAKIIGPEHDGYAAAMEVIEEIDEHYLKVEKRMLENAFIEGFSTGCDQPLLNNCFTDFYELNFPDADQS